MLRLLSTINMLLLQYNPRQIYCKAYISARHPGGLSHFFEQPMAHDIELIDGDLPLVTRRITGVELIAQRIRIRLRTFLGEWLLDRRVGLPFLRWRKRRAPPLASIASRVSEEVRTTRGVLEVRRVRAVQDGEVVRVSGE